MINHRTSLHTRTIFVLLLLFSFGFGDGVHGIYIEKASWLLGTWENKTPRGSLYETWIKKTDTEFSGLSYRLKGADTVVLERIQLVERDGGLFYVPTVPDQNLGRPVTFSMKSVTESRMVFEDPEHDFPQLISYTRVSPDSLVAEISGHKDGTLRSQRFPMKRLK